MPKGKEEWISIFKFVTSPSFSFSIYLIRETGLYRFWSTVLTRRQSFEFDPSVHEVTNSIHPDLIQDLNRAQTNPSPFQAQTNLNSNSLPPLGGDDNPLITIDTVRNSQKAIWDYPISSSTSLSIDKISTPLTESMNKSQISNSVLDSSYTVTSTSRAPETTPYVAKTTIKKGFLLSSTSGSPKANNDPVVSKPKGLKRGFLL
jgi:hypothetical protein